MSPCFVLVGREVGAHVVLVLMAQAVRGLLCILGPRTLSAQLSSSCPLLAGLLPGTLASAVFSMCG